MTNPAEPKLRFQTLALRREHWRTAPDLEWIGTPEGVLAFRRGELECWLNTGDAAVPLPEGSVLLASQPDLPAGELPTDTAVWLSAPRP